MVTNYWLNENKEEGCFGITVERKYYHVKNTFIKRSLRPREWQTVMSGKVYVPRRIRQRILNEAAALDFVANNTTIPVPKLHACFEDDQAIYLIMEYVEGRGMHELCEDEKLVVHKELEDYLKQIHALRSNVLGGPSGIVVPPYRLELETDIQVWNMQPAHTDEYVFCHNDISQHNIIICNDSLKIAAIIDWEYAGYWPEAFESRFYMRIGPSSALSGEEDDGKELLQFMKDHSVAQESATAHDESA
jgi:serine/threonine protein kinase